MKLKKTILLLDNNEEVLESTRVLLVSEGYTVFASHSKEDALKKLENERIYLAVIDVRLKNDLDPDDVSGLDFADSLNPEIAKIILTGFLTPAINRRALTKYIEKIVPAEDAVSKQDGPKPLIEAIERLFKKISGQVNLDSLKIEFNRKFSLQALMEPIREDFPLLTEDEVEELIRRLFKEENMVKIYFLPPGRGGAGVALIRPYYEGMEGATVVMKFGLSQIIEREIERYKKYVEPFVQPHSTIILGQPVKTHHLAACRLLFVGSTKDHLLDFDAYYTNSSNSDEDLREVIHNIFFQTCRIWYQGKKKWLKEDGLLSQALELQLWPDASDFHRELQTTLMELANGESFHNVTFKKFQRSISANVDGQQEELHNPLYVVTHSSNNLPTPSFASITHGDLNGHNLFVDEKKMVWLIDFYKTGWGPALRDAAELESSIKFQLIKNDNLPKLLAFERALLKQTKFSEELPLPVQFQKSDEFQRAFMAIQSIRRAAAEIGETDIMDEYYAILMYYALKMMTWKGISSTDKQRRSTRQRHAFYSAALLGSKFIPINNKDEKHII